MSQGILARECFRFVENGKETVPSIVTLCLLEIFALGDPHQMVVDYGLLEVGDSDGVFLERCPPFEFVSFVIRPKRHNDQYLELSTLV
jgi:hypothetical protein